MTPDQVYLLLIDKKLLGGGVDGRTRKASALEVAVDAKGGVISGRAGDGTPIKGRVTGKSVASRLIEAEKKRQYEENLRRVQR